MVSDSSSSEVETTFTTRRTPRERIVALVVVVLILVGLAFSTFRFAVSNRDAATPVQTYFSAREVPVTCLLSGYAGRKGASLVTCASSNVAVVGDDQECDGYGLASLLENGKVEFGCTSLEPTAAVSFTLTPGLERKLEPFVCTESEATVICTVESGAGFSISATEMADVGTR